MTRRQEGMTLIELLVSLTIVLVVMGVATAAYLKLVRSYKSQGKVSQSYMENVTGLELLRYDIEMAGYGLPASVTLNATYPEAQSVAVNPATNPYYNPADLNDHPTFNPPTPRALVSLNNFATALNQSDILTIKSVVADINPVSKKWSMITQVAAANPKVKRWGGAVADPVLDFAEGDRFIVLGDTRQLLPANAGLFTLNTFHTIAPNDYYSDATPFAGALMTEKVYFIYGLDSVAGAHKMPFNRVDYYLARTPDTPASCAASTGTLYRSTIAQTGASAGLRVPQPMMDCVRDFQVAFGLAPDASGSLATWAANLAGLSADDIRNRVREVRVFILLQEGAGDLSRNPTFRFSGTLNLGDQDIAHSLDSADYAAPPATTFQTLSVGDLPGTPNAQLHSFTPAGVDAQYKWRVQTLAVKPMNLK